jgi:hypothetical protein
VPAFFRSLLPVMHWSAGNAVEYPGILEGLPSPLLCPVNCFARLSVIAFMIAAHR